ncbi:hypothetical protein F0P96_19090 [Hymenobacter busanensis]|uniref:Uncharacterized protein n=1 Tax=Hymenobacter busanensis TaxID=2607656 RepID=A0A7L4ZT44_9BACT|nr:hypothetical protein [Hymenobacter busanensis]KAA9325872.1 hypothetical protein F0P96_19090 [Hymenobacter busanensis]QHJ06288.1 hypothetical protein GUY19_02835 [Hymenobacter busanensis]
MSSIIQVDKLYQTAFPAKPEFDGLENWLSDFFSVKTQAEVLLITSVGGKPDKFNSKRLMVNQTGSYCLNLNYKGEIDTTQLRLNDDATVRNILGKIPTGHYLSMEQNSGAHVAQTILLVRRGKEVIFSYIVSRNCFNNLDEADQNKIRSGYELALRLENRFTSNSRP